MGIFLLQWIWRNIIALLELPEESFYVSVMSYTEKVIKSNINWNISDDISSQKEFKYQKPEEACEITALSFGRDEQILLGDQNGNVSIFDPTQNKCVKKITDLEGDGRIVGLNMLDKTIIAARHDGIINLRRSKKKTSYFDINLDDKATLETMVLHTGKSSIVGTGGEQNDLKLWDVETHQCVFKAKSVRLYQRNKIWKISRFIFFSKDMIC